MRSAAQIVSYELPAAMALLQVALLAGTLSPQGIVRAQGGLPHEWFVFANPFAFACFFIYFIAGLAEGNRTPFDLPEAESELVAGFTTEYSGFRYGVFSLAEWTNLYVLGAIVSTTFLGGWNLPFVTAEVVAGVAAAAGAGRGGDGGQGDRPGVRDDLDPRHPAPLPAGSADVAVLEVPGAPVVRLLPGHRRLVVAGA